ncbi:aspartate ammonia-lyase [Simiduia litorea]
MNNTRLEMDSIGSRAIDSYVYYGVQTQRALENFSQLGKPLSAFPRLLTAMAQIKIACAQANAQTADLAPHLARAISNACEEIIQGQWHDQFPVSLLQGGAGTSTNMNVNEVVANRGLELLGHNKGEYQYLHPNDHVNCGQSTNDVYPTALRLALYYQSQTLTSELSELVQSFLKKGQAFSHIAKVGRTQMQDAVPMTLGQEFTAFGQSLQQCENRITTTTTHLLNVNLGGTAIGTGINASPDFRAHALGNLRILTGLNLKHSNDLLQASWDTGDLVDVSSTLKRLAINLSKIANDLRLLSSGPHCGFNEIHLPKMQPGSSIMPGKVNPVIPETINQIAFDVIGKDHAVCMAAEQAQLQLNAFEPLMAECLFTAMDRLLIGCQLLREKCVDHIEANTDQCEKNLRQSHALATLFNPLLGYKLTSELINESNQLKVSFVELVQQRKLLSTDQMQGLLESC